jgi:membrane-associated HD superfamily phosphohydrolase
LPSFKTTIVTDFFDGFGIVKKYSNIYLTSVKYWFKLFISLIKIISVIFKRQRRRYKQNNKEIKLFSILKIIVCFIEDVFFTVDVYYYTYDIYYACICIFFLKKGGVYQYLCSRCEFVFVSCMCFLDCMYWVLYSFYRFVF